MLKFFDMSVVTSLAKKNFSKAWKRHLEAGIYTGNATYANLIRANRHSELEKFYQRNYFAQKIGMFRN